jgi:hypothetical protein
MFCHKCGNQIAEDFNFCEQCGAKVDPDINNQPETEPEAKKDKLRKSGVVTKILLGKNITAGLKVPEKPQLERKAWYRLFRVLFFVAIIIIIFVSIGIIFASYDEMTYCYFSDYSYSYYGSCMDGAEAFFLAMAVGIFSLYALFVILNLIRLTFYYIIYGKK